MNGRPAVRVVEGVGDRPQQPENALRFVSDSVAEDGIQRPPVDHLCHEVRAVAVIRKLVEPWNGRMLEGDVGPQLEEEPAREADIARDSSADCPQRHLSVEARMLGLVDHAEAVGLDLAQDSIAAYVVTVAAHVNLPAEVPAGVTLLAMKLKL